MLIRVVQFNRPATVNTFSNWVGTGQTWKRTTIMRKKITKIKRGKIIFYHNGFFYMFGEGGFSINSRQSNRIQWGGSRISQESYMEFNWNQVNSNKIKLTWLDDGDTRFVWNHTKFKLNSFRGTQIDKGIHVGWCESTPTATSTLSYPKYTPLW